MIVKMKRILTEARRCTVVLSLGGPLIHIRIGTIAGGGAWSVPDRTGPYSVS